MIGLELYSEPSEQHIPHNPSVEQFAIHPYFNRIGQMPLSKENESADIVYLCHKLEHLDEHDAIFLLAEVFRVLKHGGVIQLTCTDFAKICKIYKREGSLDYAIGGVDKIKDLIGQTVFDEDCLRKKLTEIGFTGLNFHRVNPRYFDDDFIERFGEDVYRVKQFYEIYVEGYKP